jgi:hypothetical protein
MCPFFLPVENDGPCAYLYRQPTFLLPMEKQTTSHILMVRPESFGFNPQAALSNHFQSPIPGLSEEDIRQRAIAEFEGLAQTLRSEGVTVNIVHDSPEPKKPDAVFPNNWGSYHADGTVVLYPMCSPNRRWERRRSILDMLEQGYRIEQEIDLAHYEADGKFLEGTGSMIFDRPNRLCYACLSERTDEALLREWCAKMGYEPVVFHALDGHGKAIYHTNVMMGLGTHFAVVCLESVPHEAERAALLAKLQATGKEVVDISLEQVGEFAGNVIELEDARGERLLVMSSRAYAAFTPGQRAAIERSARMVHAPIPTIEQAGGGSARCMIAEVFLPLKNA